MRKRPAALASADVLAVDVAEPLPHLQGYSPSTIRGRRQYSLRRLHRRDHEIDERVHAGGEGTRPAEVDRVGVLLIAGVTWSPDLRYTLEARMKLEASNLTVTGGVLLKKTLIYPKPRAVFTWSPDPHDQVRLRVERTVGELEFASFVATSAFNTTNSVHVGNPKAIMQFANTLC